MGNPTAVATSRTIARFYLLRPDPVLDLAFRFILAYYAVKHSITLAAACLMSTHYHLVFFDSDCRRSLFLRDVNRALANVVKAYRGWSGEVFHARPNVVRLLTAQAVADKIGYVLANPVAAGAVRRAKDWPGLCAGPRSNPQAE